MLANHIRHSLPFVCLLLLGLLLPQALAESEMQVKVLDEPLAIEMPVDLDQNVFVEAKYVAVVKGVSEFFDHVPFKKVMEHAQDDVGSFLTKEYGRTVLHYINGQPYSVRSRGRPSRGLSFPSSGSPGLPQVFDLSGMITPVEADRPVDIRPRRGISRSRSAPSAGVPSYTIALPTRIRPQKPDSSEPLVHEFRILAETPERAEQLARALIAAHNSYVESNRRTHQGWLKEREARLPEQKLAFEKAQQQYDELSQQLDALEPIPPQVYEELKTKEWTLRVEMAGVEGRLKAAKKLTSTSVPSGGSGGRGSRDRGRGGRPTTVENDELITQVAERISITSQIELAGLLEQLNKIDEFLQTYRHYAQLTAKKKSANKTLERAKTEKASTERGIESLKKELEEQLVPFELTEPVQIRPIEWTKGSR